MTTQRFHYGILLLCLTALTCLSCGPGKYRVEDFKQVTRVHPSEADEYYNLGVAYSITEREQDAAKAFQEAVRLNPDDAQAYFDMGMMYSILGRNDEAVDAYTKAFGFGRITAKHYQLGLAYRLLGRNEEAASELEHAINEREPHPLTSYYTLGLALYDLGRYEKALEVFTTALALNPSVAAGYYTMHYFIARTLVKSGREGEAASAYREALRYRPDFIPAYLELGSLLSDRGDTGGATELYEKLRTLDVNAAAALRKHIEDNRK